MAFEDALLGVVIALVLVLIYLVFRVDSKARPTREFMDKAAEVRTVAGELSTGLSALRTEVGNIREHATKIATLSENYKQTQEQVTTIHSIPIGSYSKGKSGEQILRNTMAELVKGGFVETNIPFGSKVVEYGVRFRDGKILAIDSKFTATRELEMVNADGISEEEKASITRDMVNAVSRRIGEVAEYIDPGMTLPFAVMAIPDSLMEYSPQFVGEASRRNVIVAGYSSAPSLVAYFLRVQEAYSLPKDIEELKESLQQIELQLGRFDEDFFANRFDRPLGTIQRASQDVRDAIRASTRSARGEEVQEAPRPLEDLESNKEG